MPCFLLIVLLGLPRLALFLMWLSGDYLARAYQTVLWPLLGFFFAPYTTICYAVAYNQTGGNVGGAYVALIVLGVLIDLGVLGGGSKSTRTIVVERRK